MLDSDTDFGPEVEVEQIKHGCGNIILVKRIWTPGGVNDYGGYVLKCRKCKAVFHYRLGRDVNDSKVSKGADILDTYDEGVEGDKAAVLKRHGLSERQPQRPNRKQKGP